jgi:uncharacterized damage-inducible protein DinB
MRCLVPVLAVACATAAMAQQPKGATAPASAIATTRGLWEEVTNYISRAADQVSEADYGFKPTPLVRSFGQLIAHIAGTQDVFCAAALGETGGNEDDIEKTKSSKTDLIAALKASNEHCRRAYALADAASGRSVSLFGENRTVLYALMMNTTHDNEHYGNIVTYMRLRGMVPPSSQPSR